MSCGKFVFPSQHLPLPILDVPSPCGKFVFNSLPATSHLGRLISCGKICLPISLPATSHLGRPIFCGKFVFQSHYLPLPILDVPSSVVNSSSHLITCHFPSWTSHLLVNPSSQLIACHFPSWTSHLLW